MRHVIAHVDMDCFYCSCEVKKNPSLKGKPVIVGSTGDRGVVSAANYEARAFGVYSATAIGTARRLCPKGVFLGGDMEYYHEQSQMVMEIFKEIAEDMQQVSVDEAFLNLTGYSKKFDSLEEMGEHIKQMVYDRVGLTCSIGISESRKVAKIASDYNKPNGVTVVHNMKEFLEPLGVEKIPGIGKKSKYAYYRLGINTIGDLAKFDRFKLMDNFGMYGVNHQKLALGQDFGGIIHGGYRDSFSRETTFKVDVADKSVLENEIEKISEVIFQDSMGVEFKTISIKLRYSDFTTITRDRSLKVPMSDLGIIISTAKDLFRNVYAGETIRLIGVKISGLYFSDDIQTKVPDFDEDLNKSLFDFA